MQTQGSRVYRPPSLPEVPLPSFGLDPSSNLDNVSPPANSVAAARPTTPTNQQQYSTQRFGSPKENIATIVPFVNYYYSGYILSENIMIEREEYTSISI